MIAIIVLIIWGVFTGIMAFGYIKNCCQTRFLEMWWKFFTFRD